MVLLLAPSHRWVLISFMLLSFVTMLFVPSLRHGLLSFSSSMHAFFLLQLRSRFTVWEGDSFHMCHRNPSNAVSPFSIVFSQHHQLLHWHSQSPEDITSAFISFVSECLSTFSLECIFTIPGLGIMHCFPASQILLWLCEYSLFRYSLVWFWAMSCYSILAGGKFLGFRSLSVLISQIPGLQVSTILSGLFCIL